MRFNERKLDAHLWPVIVEIELTFILHSIYFIRWNGYWLIYLSIANVSKDLQFDAACKSSSFIDVCRYPE